MTDNGTIRVDRPPLIFDIEQARRELHMGRQQIYDEMDSGRLRNFRRGSRRFISWDALQEWVQAREAESAQAG